MIEPINQCAINETACCYACRLIKHTKQLLEENEERLCIKVLQTLREMMTKDRGYGEKVGKAAEMWNSDIHDVYMV